MKKQKIGKIAGLAMAVAIGIGASSNANADFTFQKITANNQENLSSQLSMAVSGSGQSLFLRFYNNVGTASSICDIYIDAPPAGLGETPNPYFTAYSVSGSSGVSFSGPANPDKLPGGADMTPDFVAVAQSVDSDHPKVLMNGVNLATEWVQLALTLNSQTTVAGVIAALNSGQFRVGLHVQGIGDRDGSDSYVTAIPVTAVPEPTTVIAGALLLLPFGASAARILRKKA